MSDFLAFLRARLAEDEARAEDGLLESWHTKDCGFDQLEYGGDCHCEAPARALRDVEAKRQMIRLHDDGEEHACIEHDADWGSMTGLRTDCPTLLLLAAPFSGHPDYDPTWAVDMSDSDRPTGR